MISKYTSMNLLKYLLILLVVFTSCGDTKEPQTIPIPEFDKATLAENIKILSSDEFEGRAPSSPGEEKTIQFLETQFKNLGTVPGNGSSYFQKVPLLSISAASAEISMEISTKTGTKSLSFGDEFVAVSPLTTEEVKVENSEIVFVGYGIVAPEYNWNDYEGLDVKGKTVVMLVNDPGYATQDEELFTGNAMTYYGRWTYKFEEAERQGAAAALIIHQTGPAGYPWGVVENGWSGEQFYQAGNEGTPQCKITGWITEEVAASWFEAAGMDMDQILDSAVSVNFTPQTMRMQASISLKNTIKTSESNNVIAVIPGRTKPDEYIIYTAHWDHLGMDTTLEGDQIFNGAFDNATGVAGLIELARAFKETGEHDRSIVFMPVTAEEQGLLGSAYYAENPVFPLDKTVAVINIDGLNIFGRMKDIIIIGSGNSQLDDYINRAAEAQNRVVKPDPQPEKGYYFRSDHFSFAKKGVPSMYTDNGVDHETHGEAWTKEQMDKFTAEKYHKPGDEFDPNWDYTGAMDDLGLFFRIGYELANSDDWPEWNEGVPFKAIREE